MFDSMEAGSHRTSGCSTISALAEAFLRAEILDVVCGEGSACAERHDPWVVCAGRPSYRSVRMRSTGRRRS